jgi:NADH:ubiquinone oxidoreductase subunit E
MSESNKCTCCNSQNIPEEELLKDLDNLILEYQNKPGALIPVLQITQGMFGYLPEIALKKIAIGLNQPYSEVAGVVSFYSNFTTIPRGKHLVRVCMGTACYVRGGKLVLDAIKRKLGIDVGETTEDRMFSLEIARCFGACGLAPTIAINDEVYKRVRPSKVSDIIDSIYHAQTEEKGVSL